MRFHIVRVCVCVFVFIHCVYMLVLFIPSLGIVYIFFQYIYISITSLTSCMRHASLVLKYPSRQRNLPRARAVLNPQPRFRQNDAMADPPVARISYQNACDPLPFGGRVVWAWHF